MSGVLLYTGIVLVAVPLMVMIGFATFIFWSFMQDDDMTAGILRVGLIIMAVGAAMIIAHFVQVAVAA